MIEVGAIWRISESEAQSIDPFFEFGLVAYVSADVKYWFAHADNGKAIFKVGADFGTLACAFSEQPSFVHWRQFRDAFASGRFGEPVSGAHDIVEKMNTLYGPKPVVETKPTVTCKCDIATIAAVGCPSHRGLPCPSIK